MSFDNRGRLWVSTMPSYPHYQPGDAKPNDKLIILKTWTMMVMPTNKLFLPTTFTSPRASSSPLRAFISPKASSHALRDTDHDGRADRKEIILSGFDDHDTHHVISASAPIPPVPFLWVKEHSPQQRRNRLRRRQKFQRRFFRYSPQRHHLEKVASRFPTLGEQPLMIGANPSSLTRPIQTFDG